MARFALAGLSAALLTAAAGAAAGQQSQVQAAYDRQCKATEANSGGAYASTLDPGFIAIGLDRDRSLSADVIATIVTPPQSASIQTCRVLIRAFQVDGTIATVLETQTSSGTLITGDSLVKPFVRVRDAADVWKLAGRPVEIASQRTGERLTVDGEVVLDRGILASPEP